jgi:hypothetical protein
MSVNDLWTRSWKGAGKGTWSLTVFCFKIEECGCGRHGASLVELEVRGVLDMLLFPQEVEDGANPRYTSIG